MKLTDVKIKAARPRERSYKLADGNGLTLLIQPSGAKLWRFRYRWQGRERMLSFGSYPSTGLRLARAKREDARQQLAANRDPSAQRKAERRGWDDTFDSVATEYIAAQAAQRSPATVGKAKWILREYLSPEIGSKPIASMTPADLLATLRKIETTGRYETAHRAMSLSSRVFRYALADGRAERDITRDLRGALQPVPTKHRAAITEPKHIGELMRAIDGYVGEPSTSYALKLAPLVFVRPGELRAARWQEFALESAQWVIPAARIKRRKARSGATESEDHLVPLSRQTVKLLSELHQVTGRGALLFPSLRSRERPISDNTINAALRRLGFAQDEMTCHGFRAMARTVLDEVLNFRPDIIEHQLAHVVRDPLGRAYNRTKFIEHRQAMMQKWADYLDELREAKE